MMRPLPGRLLTHGRSLARGFTLLGATLMWAGACATVPASGTAPVALTATEDVIFYASSELAAPPQIGVLLEDSTLRYVPIRSQASSATDSAAGPLIAALAYANEHRRPVSTLALSNHFRVVSTDTLQHMFADRGKGWERFFSTYPSDRGFYGITAPVFSPDSLTALVYVEYHCGALCGNGELFLVRRDGRRWRTARRLRHWIS